MTIPRKPTVSTKLSPGDTAVSSMTRRSALIRLAQLGLLGPCFGLVGCGGEKLRVGIHVWPGYEFLPVARQRGWLDGQDIELVETQNATHTQELFVAGSIDAAALTLDEVLRIQAAGLPVRVVLVFDVSVGADTLLANKGVPNLAALKGRRIAVEAGAVGTLVLQAALASAGLTEADVTRLSLPLDQHARALASGSVAAVVSYEPQSGLLEAAGYRRLFDSRAMPETIFDVLAVRADRLERRQTALAALVAAHFQALNEFRRNPDDMAFTMAARLGVPGQEVQGMFSGLFLPGSVENRRLLSGTEKKTSPLDLAAVRLRQLIGVRRPLTDGAPGIDLASADFLPGAER